MICCEGARLLRNRAQICIQNVYVENNNNEKFRDSQFWVDFSNHDLGDKTGFWEK